MKKASLVVATLLLIGGRAHAQNYWVIPVVPKHVFIDRGGSFRNGDWFAIEPSALFLYNPIRQPVVMVTRAVLGVGGSGGSVGLAMNLMPECPDADLCWQGDDFFAGPFLSLEGRVERMYGPTRWRPATYAGPQLTFSIYVLKASVGWMADVNQRANHHVQVGFGAGF